MLRGVRLGTGRDGIYRWEGGRTPEPEAQLLIAELLGIDPEALVTCPWPNWLALDPLQRPPHRSWDAHGAIAAINDVSKDRPMDRRNRLLLTGVALTTSLWEWLTADPAVAGQITQGRRLGEAAVARLEQRVLALRHDDDIDGGGELVREADSALRLVASLLEQRTYSDAHGARLHAAAADLARMKAWAIFDVHDTCDDATFEAALHTAHAADDPALGCHILAFWAIAAYNTARAADAEAMIDAALSAARGRATPRVQAMLYSRRARARAHQRDAKCWRDLDQAGQLLHQGTRDEDPDWVAWFDEAELLGALASSQLDMDQPSRAEQTFVDASALFPRDRVRTQSLFLARQADAQWRQGEVDGACVTAHQALDLSESISSHRSTGPLHDLAARMGAHAGIAAVADFRDRLQASQVTG
ncbi:XRE family transcriptional regulator [Streptomyces noursei]|uniref:XRE family transcriptional regulator n=1 Tax=Streptomyces noursei TaxID=1971 RepID=UPI0035E32E5A